MGLALGVCFTAFNFQGFECRVRAVSVGRLLIRAFDFVVMHVGHLNLANRTKSPKHARKPKPQTRQKTGQTLNPKP